VDLAGLFTMGDARASDLLAACHSTNDKIASAAFFMLRLLGRSESVDCGNSISRKHKRLAFPSGSNFTNVDFNRIEEWLAKKRAEKEYECGDDSEPIEPADSLVYELVLTVHLVQNQFWTVCLQLIRHVPGRTQSAIPWNKRSRLLWLREKS